MRVTVSTFFFVTSVLARAACHRSLAPSTYVVMTASCEPMLADVVDLVEEVAEAVGLT